MKFKNIFVTYYPKHEPLAEEICEHLRKKYKIRASCKNMGLIKEVQSKIVDLVISVGGDGTFIKSASMFTTKMIMGVKSSDDSLGYHCSSDRWNYKEHLELLMKNRFSKRRYFGLGAKAGAKKLPCAFNEVLLAPGSIGEMFNYSLDVEGRKFSGRSTALIVYTPAGSTAHAKSAGGAQLSMKLDAIGIVPESQFSGDLGNLIIPSNKLISVKSKKKAGMVLIDGWYKHKFKADERIDISKGRGMEVVLFD